METVNQPSPRCASFQNTAVLLAKNCVSLILQYVVGTRGFVFRGYDAACAGEDFLPTLREIRQRFADIIAQLQLQVDLTADFETIASHLCSVPQRDYMASRGEYLNSKLLAAYLGVPFIDAAQMILFHADGSFDVEASNTTIARKLANVECAVIPGFYGTLPDGMIHTFSRGGSDVTGSIIACAVGADLYENWTDVSGVLAADPRIVENPRIIDYITYRELRELSYMDASVLHEDAHDRSEFQRAEHHHRRQRDRI